MINVEEHQHQLTVHDHPHLHVTHQWDEALGDFSHVGVQHTHAHDHAEVSHSHVPHGDVPTEHQVEAHIHDHDVPVKDR